MIEFFFGDDSLNEAIEQESIQESVVKVLLFKIICLCFVKTEILCLVISF